MNGCINGHLILGGLCAEQADSGASNGLRDGGGGGVCNGEGGASSQAAGRTGSPDVLKDSIPAILQPAGDDVCFEGGCPSDGERKGSLGPRLRQRSAVAIFVMVVIGGWWRFGFCAVIVVAVVVAVVVVAVLIVVVVAVVVVVVVAVVVVGSHMNWSPKIESVVTGQAPTLKWNNNSGKTKQNKTKQRTHHC